MGLETLCMMISSNVKFEAWLGGDPGHVLIRTPLVVPDTVQFRTVTPDTSSSFMYLPRLPTLHDSTGHCRCWHLPVGRRRKVFDESPYLMPWPGPQVTSDICKLFTPWPIEIQSSPVPMLRPVKMTLSDLLMWMPSVLGLSAGADIWRRLMVTEELCWTPMWNPLLLTKVRLPIVALVTLNNLMDCMHVGEKDCFSVRSKIHNNMRRYAREDSLTYDRTAFAASSGRAVGIIPRRSSLAIQGSSATDLQPVEILELEPPGIVVVVHAGNSLHRPKNLNLRSDSAWAFEGGRTGQEGPLWDHKDGRRTMLACRVPSIYHGLQCTRRMPVHTNVETKCYIQHNPNQSYLTVIGFTITHRLEIHGVENFLL
ncbi:hypothetical protein BHM03_00055014 [Ensete ventricosum]|nr:hypothetical protein BHM03_00055014 [Ensete ventricosum]